MVFDSLLCISKWMWDVTICLKFKLKYGQGDSKVKKHTLACSFFNQRMLINGCHFLGKSRQIVASKSLIVFFGPKQHEINASGSKLYMNLKKYNFCICQKEKSIFTTTLLSNQMHPLSEKQSRSNIQFLIHGICLHSWFPVPYTNPFFFSF